jgi:hypothetical protein
MSAARIITPPLSGRDRRHFARELHKGEQAFERLTREAAAAHQAADLALSKAHFKDCEAWTARQFIGGPNEPSPTIAQAIHGGCELLEVRCQRCHHTDDIDLTLSVWPRSRPVHTLRNVLVCGKCLEIWKKKRRPELVALKPRPLPEPTSSAAALR